LAWNFLNPTFSQDKEHSPPALTVNHPFYTMAQGGSAERAIGISGYTYAAQVKVVPGGVLGHHTPEYFSCSAHLHFLLFVFRDSLLPQRLIFGKKDMRWINWPQVWLIWYLTGHKTCD